MIFSHLLKFSCSVANTLLLHILKLFTLIYFDPMKIQILYWMSIQMIQMIQIDWMPQSTH